MKKSIIVSCPIATQSGYGNHSRSLVHSLLDIMDPDKYELEIISQPWGACPMNALSAGVPSDKRLLDHLMTTSLTTKPDIFIQITVPNEYQAVGRYNIGITAGIETTVIPMEWVKGCNNMDLIIAPSEHAKNVLVNTKFKETNNQTGQSIDHFIQKPVEVLFEGFDELYAMDTVKQVDNLDKQFEKIPEDFNFLFVGHWLQGDVGQDRKDISMLVKTFLTVFRNKKNKPGLILKSSGASFSVMDRESIAEKIRILKKTVTGDLPNIYLLHGQFSDGEMHSLYHNDKVKAHISFTKGEGYGRPLLEASLNSKPVIASNWSGHVDFLKNGAILLGGQLTPVHPSAQNKFIVKDSKWFTVNYSEAASIMLDMFKNYDKYLDNAKKLTEYNLKHFSEEEMSVEFKKILDRHINLPEQVQINLPKLKKIGEAPKKEIKLPKLV